LLAHDSYSWAAARPAMEELRRREIPLILCTSKTRSEVQLLRRALGNSDPFVVENGGLIVFPHGYFSAAKSLPLHGSRILMLGQPYQETVQALRALARQAGVGVRGFHQMSADEIADATGLSLKAAHLARKRESCEPFVFQNASPAQVRTFSRLAHRLGYSLQRGGRYWHLSSSCDKGLGVSTMIAFYRACWGVPIRTVGLGDSGNDLPMLQLVDRPVLMPKSNGSFDQEVSEAMPTIRRAGGPGPAGWGCAVLDAVRRSAANKRRPESGKVLSKATDDALQYGTGRYLLAGS
jgi:mannosyl-3-phosphoglycerate phosphatase